MGGATSLPSSSLGPRGAPPEHRLLPAGLQSRSAAMGISASSLLDDATAGRVTGTEQNRAEPSRVDPKCRSEREMTRAEEPILSGELPVVARLASQQRRELLRDAG